MLMVLMLRHWWGASWPTAIMIDSAGTTERAVVGEVAVMDGSGDSSQINGASVDNNKGDTALAFQVTMDAVVLIMLEFIGDGATENQRLIEAK
jgi:hypothetical protein